MIKKRELLKRTILMALAVATVRARAAQVRADEIFRAISVKEGVVEARVLNVRTGPGMNYPVMTALKKDTAITVVGVVGNWYVVIMPNNTVGMVYNAYIRPTMTIEPPIVDNIATSADLGGNIDPYDRRPEGSVTRVDGAEMASGPEGDDYISQAELLFGMVNGDRAANGLPEFTWDVELNKAARVKALDMAYNGFFGHDSPTMGTPFELLRDMGIFYKAAAENIIRAESLERARLSMMSDSTHVVNLLSARFDKMGTAVIEDPNEAGQYFIVQMFIDD
ncbi:MAG: CAP domain-containing protein [Clostridiales bacterium]|nr:CAP domain-containing protein [Clostridiales bacterium]